MNVELWPVERPVPYARNARKLSDAAIDKVASSIKEFGWRQPIVVDGEGVIIAGHTRLLAAKKLGLGQVPVHIATGLTPGQVKAYRLMDNRAHEESKWDDELLSLELFDLKGLDLDLALTGFESNEIDELLLQPDDERANMVPSLPEQPTSRPGDLWLCGPHRVLCGDSTDKDAVARLLGDRRPILMVTDPPYGIELDTEWRDRAGLNGHPGKKNRSAADKSAARKTPPAPAQPSYMRTEGHTNTSISMDTRADWSNAFELVPSLQVAYVWHATVYTREVLDGLLRIGFLYPQQIIWNKGRTVLTRTHYWYQHEPCWYVRKKNAPWFGKAGENSTIWDAVSPKFILGGSSEGEEKYDHPTQKPVSLMRRSILNHTRPGELVYEPFLGSGTTLAAAEMTERVCCGLEIDPKFADVVVQRWQNFTGKLAGLEEDGRTFDQVKEDRLAVAA